MLDVLQATFFHGELHESHCYRAHASRDEAAAAAASTASVCTAAHRQVQLFSDTAEGLAFELPGWNYPVVCDLTTGQVRFDNFEGRWKGKA